MTHTILLIIFSILMVPGIITTAIPVFPGMAFMFVLSLIFGMIDKFSHLSLWELAILGIIVVISSIVDYVSGIFGAKYGGATKTGVFWGAIGSFLGLFLFPPFGMFLGAFVGVFVSELLLKKDHKKATKAATGSLVGSLMGILINVLLALAFTGLFIYFAIA